MTGLYKIFENSTGVTTDSRDIRPGSVFFALHGDNFDGNKYAAEALEKGAVCAVVDNPEVAVSDKYYVVENALSTLQYLATYHRRVLNIPILAITGTNGKTTTKELVARVLSNRFRVSATKGNLNNHIGVPLTLLAMKRGDEFGIVEMGASSRGEIDLLCSIAQPNFGLITNIGKAHLDGFGSLEGVRQGKGELYDYMATHNGLVFYSTESPELTEMVAERSRMLAKGYSVKLAKGLKHHLEGEYNKYNISAAVAIGEYFGITPRQIAESIEGYIPDNMRSQRMDTGKNVLILDCYNANPSSMRAAVLNFGTVDCELSKAVILGDMLELGTYALDEHVNILGLLAQEGIKHIYLVGKHFSEAAKGTGIMSFDNVDALKDYFSAKPIKGFSILIKGSRSIGLDKIINLL